MSWLTTLDQVTESQRAQLGGKAVSLARLIGLGYGVPRSFVISTERISEVLRADGIRKILDLRSALDVSKELQARILDLVLPPSLLYEIAEKTRTWDRYAIR